MSMKAIPMEEVVFPTRTVCAMGIQTLVLTNAAGGINTRFRPGDLMLIEDHLNLMGDNPLKGPEPGPARSALSGSLGSLSSASVSKDSEECGFASSRSPFTSAFTRAARTDLRDARRNPHVPHARRRRRRHVDRARGDRGQPPRRTRLRRELHHEPARRARRRRS